jgi:hypothetical protein
MKFIFILLVLIMFTAFHIGRCYNSYRLYAKSNNKFGYKPLFLRNSVVELSVGLIGVASIVIHILV